MEKRIYTIGYGNEKMDIFLKKLKENEINTLIDIRSKPYSKWRPEFNIGNLKEFLRGAEIIYDWRGRNLGGFGDCDHNQGIKEILPLLSEESKVCIMCSEEDPDRCHRKQDLQPILEREEVQVVHLRFKEEKKNYNLSLF